MSNNKTMVITAYGHDRSIDQIAVSAFDSPDGYTSTDAKTYCDTTNRLELQGSSWVFAKIVSSNTEYALDDFLPLKFDVLFLKLHDRSIQTVLREIDTTELSKALSGAAEPIQEKIFRNMSKRAVQMLKEDIEVMGPVGLRDVEAAREKILNIIRRLAECGEIVIDHSPRDDILVC
jgi:flagellar motor switch protein FliG